MIKETIRYGKGQMPNFGIAFTDGELDELVLYIRSLRKTAGTSASPRSP